MTIFKCSYSYDSLNQNVESFRSDVISERHSDETTLLKRDILLGRRFRLFPWVREIRTVMYRPTPPQSSLIFLENNCLSFIVVHAQTELPEIRRLEKRWSKQQLRQINLRRSDGDSSNGSCAALYTRLMTTFSTNGHPTGSTWRSNCRFLQSLQSAPSLSRTLCVSLTSKSYPVAMLRFGDWRKKLKRD